MANLRLNETISKEYDERRLANALALEERKSIAAKNIPELAQIDGAITAIRVSLAIKKTKGTYEGSSESKEIENLLKRRKLILREAGFDDDFLSMHYLCPKCKDTGFVESTPCECYKRRLSELLYEKSSIAHILKEESFDNFSFDVYSDEAEKDTGISPLAAARDAFSKAKDFINSFDERKYHGLFIYGNCGTGKTFLSNCIAKELIDQGKFVFYISAIKLFELLADQAFNRLKEGGAELCSFVADSDLLIIDDLGTEVSNSLTQSYLFSCINERLIQNRPTIISSNITFEQFQKTYSERVTSRVFFNYIVIKLTGEDIRLKKKFGGLTC